MPFFAFGVNFETAPVAVRERFALRPDTQRQLHHFFQQQSAAELVLLSTCNRTEAYLYGTEQDVARVKSLLGEFVGAPWPERAAFQVEDEAAVAHIFRVSVGLSSQVLGDAQIFAQMKEAYRIAVEAGRVETVMHRLMHTAFRAARRVSYETKLAQGIGSVAHLAVAAAADRFIRRGQSLAQARILILGAGEMAEAALRQFVTQTLGHVMLTNRTQAHAAPLAEQFGVELIPWEDRHEVAAGADVVLVATGASEHVLNATAFYPQGEVLLLDISMPRNVDPLLAEKPGCTLLDLDALKPLRNTLDTDRLEAVPAAEAICAEVLAEFVTWVFHQEALQPTIQSLRDTFEAIRQQEIERHHHRFSEADREQLDRLTRSIMQKLLAVPIVRLKSSDPESLSFAEGIRLLNELFARPGCEEESVANAGESGVSASQEAWIS